jgi:polyhydroxyalkanoate synthesis regulator phasin
MRIWGRKHFSGHGRPKLPLLAVSCAWALLSLRPALADTTADEQRLLELRDTVINLVRALVEKGVITKEQAEKMIADAKTKAEEEVAANAAQKKSQEEQDKGAVRVPYIPETVKEQIAKQVAADLGPSVKEDVVSQINNQGTLRAALPDWVQRMTFTGDIRIRGEADDFGHDNAVNSYLDFNAVNAAGGIAAAGLKAYLNTTDDVDRLRLRVRFGFDTDFGDGWSGGVRVATGSNGEILATTNQTLGTYGDGYTVALEQGYLRWNGGWDSGRQVFSTTAGRFANPFLATNMVWYNDLTFEGLDSNYRLNLSSDNNNRKDIYATIGAFPLQSETPSSWDKWLAAAQLGTDLQWSDGTHVRFGLAYYYFIHTVGQANAPGSTLFNYTAPAFVQKGNTVFNIANPATPGSGEELFALAADYHVVDALMVTDIHTFSHYGVTLTTEGVKNIGYNTTDIFNRTGAFVPARTAGYEGDIGFGSLPFGGPNTWRASAGYRYLQRDAVLDAFNDEDFHLGGTDTKGYIVTADYAINRHVWARLKYMSANSIDGPPLAIDVLQIDLNAQF